MGADFIALKDVLLIHDDQIERYGGSLGVRDMGLLESAIAMPQAGFGGQYFHTDLFEMAAAYLFHLVKNHPFVDGNKRAGAATALMFLELNHTEVELSSDALVKITLAVAEGRRPRAPSRNSTALTGARSLRSIRGKNRRSVFSTFAATRRRRRAGRRDASGGSSRR